MRQGKTYLVKKLDLSNKTALCEEADLKYYTRTRDYTDVHVNGGNIVCQAQLFDLMFYKWLLITCLIQFLDMQDAFVNCSIEFSGIP
jgi:hypothetical protein